jgi:simple sugar transport system ATP-binding protein
MQRQSVLSVRHLSKSFGPVRANHAVSFDVAAGELVCLFGENGAGKSTLSACLAGLLAPDDGEIRLLGKPVRFSSAAAAILAGVALVHQHFVLVDDFTVLENIVLGHERSLFVNRRAAERKLAALCERHGIAIRPGARVGDLSVGERQWVELLKALYHEASVLVLDEPTATLDPRESARLFDIIAGLRAAGTAIVLITHALDEVMRSDRVVVLRQGEVVGERRTAETTPQELTRLMIGREVERRRRTASRPGRPCLEVERISIRRPGGAPVLDDVSLSVAEGEILGIAGVAGNGQKPLMEAIAGIRPLSSGRILIDGELLADLDIRAIQKLGVGHIPEDRLREGLVGDFSIAENLALGGHRGAFSRRHFLDRDAIEAVAATAMTDYQIAAPTTATRARSLSGGNAQRVVLARELATAGRVLLANQPTRGLDVGVIEYIHARLVEKRAKGCAILLASSELEDLINLSDRIAVMFQGRLMGIVDAATTTIEDLGLMMAGRKREAA